MEKNLIFESNNLKLELQENKEHLSLLWTGESTEREPGRFLTPILEQILTINEIKSKKLVMDFTQLQYMNSSTVTPIIRLIERVKSGNHQVLIIYRKNLDWQETVFSALLVFLTKDHKVEIKGE